MARHKDPDPQLRRRVLEASLDLFAEKGFDATGVAEIVSRAGVTKGALYHYFASKNDILFEIYRSTFTQSHATLLETIAADRPPAQTLRKIILDLVESTAITVKESAVFSRGARADSPQWNELQVLWQSYQDGVRSVIQAGQDSGEFSTAVSPLVTSWAIFGFTNGLHTWFLPDGPKSATEIGNELADLILAGLQP